MTTALFTHPACLGHDTGRRHPESPARLAAVLDALSGEAFAVLERQEAPRATLDDLALIHPRDCIDAILAAIPAEGHSALDPDTIISPGSGEAALRAAGAVRAAVDAVMSGACANAFCAVRPPGHHAEPRRAMGFCLFNNVAIGAAHAHRRHGCARVAVVDFDVHHGNGTQAAFAADPAFFYASTHQAPFYPGTGAAEETGIGNIVNIPLRAGAGSAAFRAAYERAILPALEEFRPDFVLVSAGFDAHRNDPLAQLMVEEADFVWVTERLMDVAARHAGSRIVSSLEGGYDLAALAASAAAHISTLMRL
ncbi:MAG TPA: histone deacetylase family protein [Stellaceae bacterium]|jgi:acetoin utilization deacetylase AcuC-like enzyme|nr:histone deacetylase family protein [Stellaceae bacterium]